MICKLENNEVNDNYKFELHILYNRKVFCYCLKSNVWVCPLYCSSSTCNFTHLLFYFLLLFFIYFLVNSFVEIRCALE